MSAFSFSLEPPAKWDRHCAVNNALFHGGVWQQLLEQSFHCRTIYGWNEESGSGMAISSFNAGPFRIGYLGFPVGGLVGGGTPGPDMVRGWKHARSTLLPHCLRIAMSAFDHPRELPIPYQSNPETAITDLQSWDLGSVSKKLRRDIKKAQHSGLTVTDASVADATALYRIYHDTVKRHSGVLRYNERYFYELIGLARSSPNVRCLLARLAGEIAGFVVTGRHQQVCYYLHGGSQFTLRNHCPSDLLLHEAITRAREDGSVHFNLMSSSNQQPTLVRYKEKWGAETRQQRTYILTLKSLPCMAFGISERIYGMIGKIIAGRWTDH